MWVLAGPFDCDEHKIPTSTKQKLLKAGVKYSLGRKDDTANLVIQQKKISRRDHFIFEVVYEGDVDPTNPAQHPKLTVVYPATEGKKAVSRKVIRKIGPNPALNPGEILYLEDADIVQAALDIHITVQWIPVACLLPPTRGAPLPDPSTYAPLVQSSSGTFCICIRPTPHPDVTHHVSPTITLSPELALSLLSVATIVTPEWLADLLKAGRAEPGKPRFRPALKQFMKWAPNEGRAGLFRGCRFIFVGEKGREVQEAMRELVKRGEGEYECYAVEGGRAGLRKVLSKGRAKGRILVLVGEEDALVPAVGKDGWQELVDEANSFEVNFISRERILEAVVETDTSLLNSDSVSDEEALSPLPDVVPNTHPDEPSIPPPTHTPAAESQESQPARSRLRRRAASGASSRAPSPPPPAPSQPSPAAEEPAEPPKRRGLIRRAGRSRTTAVDDTSMDLDGDGTPAPTSQSARQTPEPIRGPSIGPEPTPARSRLKRRAGTLAAKSDIIDLTSDAPAEADEPPLKKFRALFEQSDPERVGQSGSLETQMTTQGESVTESEAVATQSGVGGAGRGGRG
ncbi:hypothetical protein EVJ58_g10969 [Rhodofomes roseus]|uniref:BRCT domain-containing protein n=1 Tax=Rhodofomes roseus TaxID=34475 RepID=A0A4Y9XMP7_9APHY|nr:hypothetical protein EVJ58_g10969 [Rhodofomes roseus]